MKILWLSDFDLRGSGYLNISAPVCDGLSRRGHDVKVVGLGYKGQEHNWNFSLFPAHNIASGLETADLLYRVWKFDVMVVALDLTIHEQLFRVAPSLPFPYVGVFPVEAGPLCLSWAAMIMKMSGRLIISRFGIREAEKVGVHADYLQVGIDTNAWRPPTQDERESIREAFGLNKDDFIILTVADNQERKNLAAGMDIVRAFIGNKQNIRHIIVTREDSLLGWKLREYAQEIGLHRHLLIFERGMPFRALWSLYALSDAFLLPSKAEGLGLPLLEAMATGVTPVGTNCTAIAELLKDRRGFLVDYEYVHRDPFGNSFRYWIDKKVAANTLEQIYLGRWKSDKDAARKFVEGRTWDVSVDQVESVLKRVLEAATNEAKPGSPTEEVSSEIEVGAIL